MTIDATRKIIGNNYDVNLTYKVTGIDFIKTNTRKDLKNYLIKNAPQIIILYGCKTYIKIFFIKKCLTILIYDV